MSGKDERRVKSIACGCADFVWWVIRGSTGHALGYLNDENHPDLLAGTITSFSDPNAIGRVNLVGHRSSLENFIRQINQFECRGCGRRISRVALNAEPLLAYLKEHWNKRT